MESKNTYKIVEDKKFNSGNWTFKGVQLKKWDVKIGKSKYTIYTSKAGFELQVTYSGVRDGLSFGSFETFLSAVQVIGEKQAEFMCILGGSAEITVNENTITIVINR